MSPLGRAKRCAIGLAVLPFLPAILLLTPIYLILLGIGCIVMGVEDDSPR